VNAGERQKFTQQLLRIVTDPERRRVAAELFDSPVPLPGPSPKAKPLSILWGSTPAWGAVGVLFGVIASQVSLKLLVFGVWATLWAEFVRSGFFSSRIIRIFENTAVGALLGVVFVLSWPYFRPKDQPTVDQQMDLMADKFSTKFPWLATPPPSVPEAHAVPILPSEHTHVEYYPVLEAERLLGIPNHSLQSGDTPTIPVAFRNAGGFAVKEPTDSLLLTLVPSKNLLTAFRDQRKNFISSPSPSGSMPAGSTQGSYHTATGTALKDSDIASIISGDLALCGFGLVRWADDTGKYETYFSQCLEIEPDHKSSNWHVLKENNVEKKIK
jgi:hypothetical protein